MNGRRLASRPRWRKICRSVSTRISGPDKELAMTRSDLTEKLLDIKREKGWTWKYICEEIGGMSPILVTGAILGQHKLTKPQAARAAALFGLS
jgi:hypothetical protein